MKRYIHRQRASKRAIERRHRTLKFNSQWSLNLLSISLERSTFQRNSIDNYLITQCRLDERNSFGSEKCTFFLRCFHHNKIILLFSRNVAVVVVVGHSLSHSLEIIHPSSYLLLFPPLPIYHNQFFARLSYVYLRTWLHTWNCQSKKCHNRKSALKDM